MIMAAPGRFSITTGLPQSSASLARHHPRGGVDRAAGRGRHDDAHGAVGIALRGGRRRRGQRRERGDQRRSEAAEALALCRACGLMRMGSPFPPIAEAACRHPSHCFVRHISRNASRPSERLAHARTSATSYSPVKEPKPTLRLSAKSPRAAPRFSLFSFLPETGSGAPRRRNLGRACEARPTTLLRRGARPAGRARLSALHRGDFRPWAALLVPGIVRRGSTASSSQPGRSARRAAPGASRARGYEPPPQDATPRSASRTVSRNARQPSGDRNFIIS